jgi:hypothetical protein
MHKGAILDVHIVRSLRIAIHAGRKADSARRSACCLPEGSNERGDLAVTLPSVLLLVILQTIWSSACCGGPMVSAGYAGLEASPDSGFFVCCMNRCAEPQPHERSRSLGRLLGRAAAVGAIYVRSERMGSSTNEARCLARISDKIKASDNQSQGTESRLTTKRAEDLEEVLWVPGGSLAAPLD